jgi:hypothetical protein
MSAQHTMLLVAGGLHFGLLVAAGLVPLKLRWAQDLAKLDPLTRQLIWVHGFYIVMLIIAFGLGTLMLADEMIAGTVLGRALCGFIALFWAVRLGLQLTFFDMKAHLTSRLLRLGERTLTVTFTYFTAVYTWAAALPAGA